MRKSGQRKFTRTAKPRKLPFVIIFIFLVMGFVGISLDEPGRVLELAVQVCLSCIGIG